ncbi:MAG: FAD-dependent oxidoreductase [Thermoplasmata archaeon]|nr:FAD-dependent oxidoreductase [Thermoplasmata archaeon]
MAARTQDFREIVHAYSRQDAVLEAKRCIQCRRPWCVEACPITQDCREYIKLVAEEKFDEAARVTVQDNPLATSLCKVCYRYCEESCVITKKGVPIAIRQLKRAALEMGDSDLAYVPSKPKGQRVAVVGGGPAGIMAAWELGIRGYSVTVFEQADLGGGLMRTIPAYRMTDEEIQTDLRRFRNLDVTWKPDTRVGKDLSPEALLQEGYQAVFISIGTSTHRVMGIPGEDLPGVYPALAMLKSIHQGEYPKLGTNVIIVGGGDVAMDSVRSAVRLAQGGHVRLVYRRSRDEMPADREEVRGAEEEHVEFVFQKAPVRVVGTDHVEGLVVQSVELGPPDAMGRRSPVPVPGSEETLPCDTLIVAVGQRADLEGFDTEFDFKLAIGGWPEGKGPGYATAVPGVFAAGGKSVVYAMGTASDAAKAVDAYLCGLRGEAPGPRPDPFGAPDTFKLPPGYTTPIRD